MSEIHPHDALLDRLNEEQFSSQKQYGMWGGCDWHFIDADPEALVIQVVARARHDQFARNIARGVIGSYRTQFRTGLVRTWSRLSGSTDEPLLQEFPFEFEEDPAKPRMESAVLWERCAEIGWERGTEAKARPATAEVHRVVNVISAPPPLSKPAPEMTPEEVQAWAHEWAARIFGQLKDQLG